MAYIIIIIWLPWPGHSLAPAVAELSTGAFPLATIAVFLSAGFHFDREPTATNMNAQAYVNHGHRIRR